jgi:hypothetical protein
MNKTTRLAHLATVALMAAAVLVATGDGFAQSYAGLLRWAGGHHLAGWRRDSFPLLVDLFILVGELGLFALALEGHRLTRRGLSWLDLAMPAGIAAAGWTVSLVFNIGAAHRDLPDRVTAAVPPVAAMLGLLVLLRTLHRLVRTVTQVPLDALPGLTAAAEPLAFPDHDPGGVDDTRDAGQPPVLGLASAVRSAHTAGWTKKAIGEEFGLSRYRLDRLLDEPPPTAVAALNGHQPTTADRIDDHADEDE